MLGNQEIISYANTNLFRGRITEAQRRGIARIIKAWTKYGTGLHTHLAYHLATSYHETGRRMQPVRETFANSTKQAIRRLDNAFAKGQLKWVKTPYWRDGYFGRGDVQLTHEDNYFGPMREAVRAAFGVDIGINPDEVLDEEVSAFILIEGMTKGTTARGDFTGRSLSQFINAHKTDYANARKTVNPGEKDSYELIAGYAREFETAIRLQCRADGADFIGAGESLYDGRYHEELAYVQERLRELGYHEVGTVDGKWGSKTSAAIMAFRSDNDMPVDERINDAFLAELVRAGPRAIAAERLDTTAKDLRDQGSKTIKSGDIVQTVGTVGVAGGVAVEVAEPLLEQAEKASDIGTRVMKVVEPIIGFVDSNATLLLLLLGAVVVYQAWRIKQTRVEDHRTGKHVGR